MQRYLIRKVNRITVNSTMANWPVQKNKHLEQHDTCDTTRRKNIYNELGFVNCYLLKLYTNS